MLELRYIREHVEEVAQAISDKGMDVDLNQLLASDRDRRELLQESEQLKAHRNKASKEIGEAVRSGVDVAEQREEMRRISDRIKELDELQREQEEAMNRVLAWIPNSSPSRRKRTGTSARSSAYWISSAG